MEQQGGEAEREHPEAEAGGHSEESEFYFHRSGTVSEYEGCSCHLPRTDDTTWTQ